MSAEIITSAHEGAPEVDVTVVLPVFNEVGHLEKEIFRVRESMEASKYSFEILVVDDGSTDGSSDLFGPSMGFDCSSSHRTAVRVLLASTAPWRLEAVW